MKSGYTEISGGESTPSLARRMEHFLADRNGEGDDTIAPMCDVIAHSMGALFRGTAFCWREGSASLSPWEPRAAGGLAAGTLIGNAVLINEVEDMEFGGPVNWKLHCE